METPGAVVCKQIDRFSTSVQSRLVRRAIKHHSVHYLWWTLSASLNPRQGGQAGRLQIKQRLARIAGRDLGADGTGHEAGADAIRARLKQVIGRDKPDPRIEQQRKLERQRELDRDLGWEL